MSRDSLSIAPQIYILWIFLCYLLGSLNRGLKTVNPPSLNVEICKLSTVKEFSSESTTIFLNYVADCASKKRQSSKIAYKAVHISYYMTAFKGLLSWKEIKYILWLQRYSRVGSEVTYLVTTTRILNCKLYVVFLLLTKLGLQYCRWLTITREH